MRVGNAHLLLLQNKHGKIRKYSRILEIYKEIIRIETFPEGDDQKRGLIKQ